MVKVYNSFPRFRVRMHTQTLHKKTFVRFCAKHGNKHKIFIRSLQKNVKDNEIYSNADRSGLILGAMYGAYRLSYKIWLFSIQAHQEATVISCKARKSYSGAGRSTSRWLTIKYAPIVKTVQGETIAGSVFGDYESCR